MGLKFERSNDLDKLFDSFAVDPLKKEVPLEELAKQRQEVKRRSKNKQKSNFACFSIEIFQLLSKLLLFLLLFQKRK